MVSSSLYLESAAKVAVAMAPIVALVAWRRRLGALNAASWLLAYGALGPIGEHAGWTFYYTLGTDMGDPVIWTFSQHGRVHAFMAAVYLVIGVALFAALAIAGHGTTLVGLPKLTPRMVLHALRLTQSE